jgi:site-specific recombinase XerD
MMLVRAIEICNGQIPRAEHKLDALCVQMSRKLLMVDCGGTQAMQTPKVAASVDQVIQDWLEVKTQRTKNQNTYRSYSDNIRWFREWLIERGLDLDSPDIQGLAIELQRWASRNQPTAETFNHRLTTISSFYRFAEKRRLLDVANPAGLVDRAPVQPYAESKALDPEEVRLRLAAIDRSTVEGKRDYAVLSVALQTGRRKEELARLRMGDLEIHGDRVTITWQNCKGGKKMIDALPVILGRVLVEYLQFVYVPVLDNIPSDAPVWVSIMAPYKGKAICGATLSRICSRRLGVTSIHRLRHTFARAMEDVGAKVSDIQARLGIVILPQHRHT